MGARRNVTSLAFAAAVALHGANASAFCRSTTCTGDCPRDADGCKTTGARLAWPTRCVGLSLQRDGSANIPIEDVRPVVARSIAAWSSIDCAAGPASIAIEELDDVSCHAAEYDASGPNANVVLFQDTRWKYDGPDDTLAKTTVTFDPETGAILDADIELNHAYNEFTVSDDGVVYDLQSILTHELGHFIGLDHTLDPTATMNAAYDVGSTDLRTLEADDRAAACDAYPPTRAAACDPTPHGGLGDACSTMTTGGCATARGARSPADAALVVMVCAAAIAASRKKRRLA